MISVIVPVYNVERYLRECVDSILNQTYEDFEVLLVDDGSTDGSGNICDEYASKDKRVRVIHKPNGGVSSARNIGLDNARGAWLTFCDSDDFVGPDYILNLIGGVERPEIDLVFNYAVVQSNGVAIPEKYPEKTISVNNLDDLFLNNDLIWHTSTWSKLFNKQIIADAGLRYCEDVHIGEDAIFLFSYLLNCREIKVVCTCDYHYIIRNDQSLTRRLNTFKSENKGYEAINKTVLNLETKFKLSQKSLNKLRWLQGTYARRVLLALYDDSVCSAYRIKILCDMDYSNYLFYVNEDSLQGKLYQLLLKKRYFRVYDFIRKTICRFRRQNTRR